MPPQQQSVSSRKYSFETISVWALIVTLAVSVFVFIPSLALSATTTKTFVLGAGALITLALYILARLSRGNIIFPPFALLGALWLPIIAYLLSTLFSGSPITKSLWGSSLEANTFGFILIATVLGTLAALVLRRPEQYRAFLRASSWLFVVFVILQALIIVVGQFAPETIAPSFSLLGSISDMAYVLGLGLIGILLALRENDYGERTRRALLIVGVGALVLLAIANSSLVWILVALVALGLFVESVMHRGTRVFDSELDDVSTFNEEPTTHDEGRRSLVLPLVVLAISLFFLIGGTLSGALASTLGVNEVNVRPSWQSTFAVGSEVFATKPIFGSGPNTFSDEWLKYRDASINTTVFWNVNFSSGIGFLPTSFVTTGIVGAVAWIIFLVSFVVFGFRMLVIRTPQDPFIRSVSMFSFIASLYFFVIAIFSLPSTTILALTFVFVGLFISTMRFAVRGGQWGVLFSKSPRLGFVIVLSLTIVLLASVVAAYRITERYVALVELARANSAFAAQDFATADRLVQNSISFAPTATAYQAKANIALSRLGEIASSTTLPATEAQQQFQTALSDGISAALSATQVTPGDYRGWLLLGNLYAQAVPLNITGAYDSAKDAYDKAQKLNPTDPQIFYILAQLDIANKSNAKAQENLKAAIALKQDYTSAIFLLSQLEVEAGNVKSALESALAAAYFTPNNPSILFQVGILYAAQNDFTNAARALETAVNVNPQFANARYFLSAVYARQGNTEKALAEMQEVAALSLENATAVATQLADLENGKNPFPANFLSIESAPVSQ